MLTSYTYLCSSPPESRAGTPTGVRAFSRERQWEHSGPRVIAGPAVNHLLRVSLWPIGCLGPLPSGLKPRVGIALQPVSAPCPGGMGCCYWLVKWVGPREAPSLRTSISTLPSGSPSLKGETILALMGTPQLAGGRTQPQLGGRTGKGVHLGGKEQRRASAGEETQRSKGEES